MTGTARRPLRTVVHDQPVPIRALAIIVSWLVAIAFEAVAIVAPFRFVADAVASNVVGRPNNDLSDIVPGLAAALLGALSGALVAALGGSLALPLIVRWLAWTGAWRRRRGRYADVYCCR
jgi:hypothetical protein